MSQVLDQDSRSQGFPGGTVEKNSPVSAGDVVRFLLQEDSACQGEAKACVP